MLWKRVLVLVAAMVTALVLASGVALAVVKIGGPGNDTLVGTGGRDLLKGKEGDDRLRGLGGNDAQPTYLGGGYPAYCFPFPRLTGGLYGGLGNDSIDGGLGNDELFGMHGNDKLKGGKGRDMVWGAKGRDTIDLGPGNDGQHCNPRLTAEGGGGSDVVRGGTGNDSILGDTSTYGGWHNDPQGGPDKLYGQQGNDALNGDTGPDTLYGGPGDDGLVDVEISDTSKDVIYGGSGDDHVYRGLATTLTGIPSLVVTGNDYYGGEGNDVIDARYGGSERANAAKEADLLVGGPGDDTLRLATEEEPPVRDVINCGSGIDKVVAGTEDRVSSDCEHVTLK